MFQEKSVNIFVANWNDFKPIDTLVQKYKIFRNL